MILASWPSAKQRRTSARLYSTLSGAGDAAAAAHEPLEDALPDAHETFGGDEDDQRKMTPMTVLKLPPTHGSTPFSDANGNWMSRT